MSLEPGMRLSGALSWRAVTLHTGSGIGCRRCPRPSYHVELTQGAAMATESSNLYAPPKSAVKDVVGDETFELASRTARLGAAMLDGFFAFICFTPAYIMNFATLA